MKLLKQQWKVKKNIPEDEIYKKVIHELTSLLFAGALKPALFSIAGSVIISFALKSFVPASWLILWCGAMIVLSTIRLFICHQFNKAKAHEKPHIKFKTPYLFFTGLIGIGWSMIAFLPGIFSSDYSQTLVGIICTCVVYLGISVLSMNRLAQIIYITPFPLTLSLNLLMNSKFMGLEWTLLLLMFWLFMLWIGKQHYQVTVKNLTLQFINETLIQHLKIANRRERAANEAKSTFLANMSHEIRTPMNGILGMTRLVLDMQLDKKQKDLLNTVICSAESLLRILNDILDFSKIEAGQLSLEQHDFSLIAMVDNIISSLSIQAEDKNIVLENKTDFTLIPNYINGDELRLRQILVNLINNAIKFTSKGRVYITVKTIKQSADKITLEFSIVDTGIGLTLDKQETIFNSFTQGDASTARQFGGSGLGLTISKQLVEMMGGSIGVKSVEGQGSNFYFTIDVLKGKKEPSSGSGTNALDTNYTNLNILLVEDNEVNQNLAKIVLEQERHNVVIAENGFKALQVLAVDDFDAILMDIQMPGMNGLTATSIIRNLENGRLGNEDISENSEKKLVTKLKNKHIPIIAMTANALDRDRQKCKEVGMDYFLTKPFIPKDLHNALNRVLQQQTG